MEVKDRSVEGFKVPSLVTTQLDRKNIKSASADVNCLSIHVENKKKLDLQRSDLRQTNLRQTNYLP